jgi:hypothetical protein
MVSLLCATYVYFILDREGLVWEDLGMETWCPIFSKIVDSSIWRESDLVVKVFLTMLAKKDYDHVVRANAYMIGEWAKKSEGEVLEALKILSSPDRKRLEPQPFEGRRVEKVGEGWLVLNGEYYRDMMVAMNEKARKRRWAAQKRAQEREEKKAEKIAREKGAY